MPRAPGVCRCGGIDPQRTLAASPVDLEHCRLSDTLRPAYAVKVASGGVGSSAVLLGKVFENYGLLAWLRRLRQRRLEAYGIALLLVALATLLRMLLSGALLEGGPFTTLSLAIIISALVCGFWPGMMATVLSVLIGWYFFLPPSSASPSSQQKKFGLLQCSRWWRASMWP